MFDGLWKLASKVLAEKVTSPKGEPPVGGLMMPLTVRLSGTPLGGTTLIGEPSLR